MIGDTTRITCERCLLEIDKSIDPVPPNPPWVTAEPAEATP